MFGQILRGEIIEGWMEGKRGRGKPRIMMLDDIKADETHERSSVEQSIENVGEIRMPRTCFQAEHQ